MSIINYNEVLSQCMDELTASGSAAWKIFALVFAVGIGKHLFLKIIEEDEVPVHTGREDEYVIPDDGYHDRYGGHAADYIDDDLFDTDLLDEYDRDMDEFHTRRASFDHIDDDPAWEGGGGYIDDSDDINEDEGIY